MSSSVIDVWWGRKVGKVRLGTTVFLFHYMFRLKNPTVYILVVRLPLIWKKCCRKTIFFITSSGLLQTHCTLEAQKKGRIRNTPGFTFFPSHLCRARAGAALAAAAGHTAPCPTGGTSVAVSSGDFVRCSGKGNKNPSLISLEFCKGHVVQVILLSDLGLCRHKPKWRYD